MPVTDPSLLQEPYTIPKDTPPSPKRPAAEPLRARSVTPGPGKIPDPPKAKGKTPEPDIKSLPETKPVARSPTPAAELEPEPEEDDAATSLDLINMDTFTQILELDEDEDDHDFSKPMVWEYFEQAEKTFLDMDHAVEKKDLPQLSSLGHFLKGSSAALGLSRVQDSCEKIQHYGHLRDEDAKKDLTADEAFNAIVKMLKRVQLQYNEAQLWLKDFYGDEAA